MKFKLLLTILLSLFFASNLSFGADKFYVINSTNTLIHGQDGWIHDWNTADGFDQGYYYGWAYRTFTGAGTASATLTLQTNWPAGTVAIWGVMNENNLCNVTTTVEGVSNTVERPYLSTSSDAGWFRFGIFTNVSVISNIVMDVTVTGARTIYFHALMLTDNLDLAPVKGGIADLPLEELMFYNFAEPSDVSASSVTTAYTNVIANSSFELDLDNTWGAARNTNVVTPWNNKRRFQKLGDGSNQIAVHPDYEADAFSFNVYSDWFEIHEDWSNRVPYTLSIWSYCTNAANTCTFILTPQFQVEPYCGATNILSRTNTSYSVNFSPNTSLTRQNWLLPLQGGRYRLTFQTVQPLTWIIDQVMLTKGDVTNDWVPKFQAEYTLQPTNYNGDYDISATTRPIYMITYNNGAEFTRTVYVKESTVDAVVFTNYTVSLTIPAGYGTNQWNVRTIRQGPVRITTYVDDQPGNEPQELVISGLKQRVVGSPTLNTHFANHAENWTEINEACARIGFQLSRTLGQRYLLEPYFNNPSPGVYDWSGADEDLSRIIPYQIPIINVNDQRGSSRNVGWPDFFTNGLGDIVTTNYSNFIAAAMDRYGKSGGSNYTIIWESWNEPQEDDEAFVSNATNFANVTEAGILAWKAHDPSNYFWGVGGVANVGAFVTDMWTLLSTNAQTNLVTSSWHQYSQNEYLGHENYDEKPYNRRAVADAMRTYNSDRNISQIANSESGFYDTKANLATYPIWLQWMTPTKNFFASYDTRRSLFVDANDRPRVMMKWVMNGASYYTLYKGSWVEVYPGLWGSSDCGFFPNFTWSPGIIALRNFEDVLGYGTGHGKIDNATISNAEGYLGKTEDGQSIIVCWSETLSNIVMTLTNSAFGVTDQWGNQLQTNNATITLNPRPIYLLSTTLATNELQGAWENASAYLTNSTHAPDLFILRQPFGQDPPNMWASWVGGNQGRLPTYKYPDVIKYSYSVDGSTWSAESTENAANLSDLGLSDGVYTLQVRVIDNLGNSNTVTGLSFTLGTPATGGRAIINNLTIDSWSFQN